MTKLNEILLHIMKNGWGKQAFLQSFVFEVVISKKEIKMFEHMEISESMFESVVKAYYLK